ncbi:glycosyltransferase [Reichenbachiella sp.]
MKILIVANLYEPYVIGGGEISTQILAEELANRQNEVTVLTSYTKTQNQFINKVNVNRIKNNVYWSFDKNKKNKALKFIWHLLSDNNFLIRNKLEHFLSVNSFDVLISSTLDGFSGIIWKEAQKKGIKTIHILRSYSLVCSTGSMFKKGINCISQCFECILLNNTKKNHSNKYVNGVVGISKYILNKHTDLGYFSNSKKNVIYNSIGLKDKIETSSPGIIKFGFVGSLMKKKGIELLLDNFAALLPTMPCELHIYGAAIDTDYKNNLKAKYKSEKIFFKGYKKQELIFPSIDLLVVPSLWQEPFGRIIIEANNYSVPVIGSKNGGIPEIIHDGHTGYLFDIDKEFDLMEKMKNATFNLAELRKNCFNHSRQFSNEIMIDNYMSFIKSL